MRTWRSGYAIREYSDRATVEADMKTRWRRIGTIYRSLLQSLGAILLVTLFAAQVPAHEAVNTKTEGPRLFRPVLADIDVLPWVQLDVPPAGLELTDFVSRVHAETGLQITIQPSVLEDMEEFGERRVTLTESPIRFELEKLEAVLFLIFFENGLVLLRFDELLLEPLRHRYRCSNGHGIIVDPDELEQLASHRRFRRSIVCTYLWKVSDSWFDSVEMRLRQLVDRERLWCYRYSPGLGMLELRGRARELVRIIHRVPDSVATREGPGPFAVAQQIRERAARNRRK